MTPRGLRLLPLLVAGVLVGCEFSPYGFGDPGHWEFPDGTVPDTGPAPDVYVVPDGCVPTPEVCDGQDNDCDGLFDEDEDGLPLTLADPSNCGVCGFVCQFANAIPACEDASCVLQACNPGYWDINGDADDGCEYPCLETAGGEEICDGRDNDCNGLVDETFDLDSDPLNCGECANVCVFLNGVGDCQGGHCVIGWCQPPYADADGDPLNGCECLLDLVEGATVCTEGVPGTCAASEVCADLDQDGTAHCAAIPPEVCDGRDNDCNGLTDADDDLSADPRTGIECYGDPDGLCADPAHAGATTCEDGEIVCGGAALLHQGQVAEVCNGLDDDCDGTVDDGVQGAGVSCGQSANYPCRLGTMRCVDSGGGPSLECVGAIPPGTETCNGLDDDCDGEIDRTGGQPPSDAVGPCNVPVPPPPGATSPCQAGTLACVGGGVVCQGSTGPTGAVNACGDDSNCDGVLTNQPDLQTSVANCGACGNDCQAAHPNSHATWGCVNGTCQFQGCSYGWHDLNGDQTCEYACLPNGSETCNGLDDDCNGLIDDGLTAPTPVQVCGVSPVASRAECTTQVSVTCQNGAWTCGFPTGVCNPTCAGAAEVCDTLDNNCNGQLNENVSNYGLACTSDAGLPYPGHGACRTTGTYVCNGPNATACSALKADCATLPGGCTELCDGIDNDCDGLVDEPFSNKGSNAANFVRPAVTKIAASVWIYQYEASRPSAGVESSGVGNGYHTSAPTGTTLDKTYACSVQGRIPWFNVTPTEVEQTCTAMGGRICTTAEWTTACQANQSAVSCTWGYAPNAGATCTSTWTASKYCNLGVSYDFDAGTAGDQDGLLVTGSPALLMCYADWDGLQGNDAVTGKIYDLTGNLREITRSAAGVFPLMGGAFNTGVENGATCTYSFYKVDADFQLLDTGFRCCFDANPTL